MGIAPMRMVGLVVLVCAATTGLSCKGERKPTASTTAPILTTSATLASSTTALPSVAIPSSASWHETPIPEIGYALRLPAGVKVRGAVRADQDLLFYLDMPSGYEAYVSNQPHPIAKVKAFYSAGPYGTVDVLVSEDDAVLAHRVEQSAAGAYCEVSACKTLPRSTLCTNMEGAKVAGSSASKMTQEECVNLIAIIRSLRALP
jgi:hypothetical protein